MEGRSEGRGREKKGGKVDVRGWRAEKEVARKGL